MTHTPEQMAKIFGCTVEQLKGQMVKNAMQMDAMAQKAKLSKTGKYRGFTAEYLENKVAQYLDFAA